MKLFSKKKRHLPTPFPSVEITYLVIDPHISDLPIFCKVFLKNMNDFATVNGIYANFFGDHKPARSAVEVSRLPRNVLVEVEAITR